MYGFTTAHALCTSLCLIMMMGVASMAQGTEEPSWTSITRLGDVEVRHYEETVQAVTTLPSERHTGTGFKRLAGFIFGGNHSNQEIAMTAPVQEALYQEQPEMAFTMPSQYHFDELPQPNDPTVELRVQPARTVAVVAFSGWATAAKIDKKTTLLRDTLEQNGILETGELYLNQYNPPWTPPFMRRNEVMVEISPQGI